MFHQPITRNQRTKGSNIKIVLQVLLLLSIAVWLLYQMKHSYAKRMEYSGTGDVDAYLGRKGKAGSENVFVIDTHETTSDESVETNEDGGGQADAVDEEENMKKGDKESKEDGSNEERQLEKVGNEVDAMNNDLSKGKEEVLDLPGEESDSTLGKDDHRDGGDDSFEREVPPKDNNSAQSLTTDEVKSDAQADISDEQATEISENLTGGSETTGNTTIEDASTDARSDDESHLNEHKDEESTNTETSERDTNETTSDNTAEVDTTEQVSETTETDLDKELPDSSISTEGDSNGTTKTDELESQIDNASGNSVSVEKFEKASEDKLDDQTNMQREEVEAQGDKSSDAEITTNDVSVEEKADNNVDKIVMPADTEDAKVEATETLEGTVEEKADNNVDKIVMPADTEDAKVEATETLEGTVEEKADNNVDKIVMPADTGDAKVEVTETLEGNASDAVTNNSLPETKDETKSEDEVTNSSQSNDEPQGDGGIESQNTSENALQDTETHLNSNGQTNSESGR